MKLSGFLFNSGGIQPDEEQKRATQELKEPCNKRELQFFVGMLNYLRSFILNLSEIVTPFR